MPSTSEKDARTSSKSTDAMDALLGFGTLMMRAGNTAGRTREWIEAIARKLGFDAISISLSLDSITASVRRSGERITAMCETGPPGINVWRIAELEQALIAKEQINRDLLDSKEKPKKPAPRPREEQTQSI